MRQRGFTYVEALVALVVLTATMSIAFRFLTDFGTTMNTESSTLSVQQSARVALDELARGVRQVGYGTERTDAFNPAAWQRSMIHAGSHVLAFNADLDANLGPIPSSVSVSFPSGPAYSGEGSGTSQDGAETYFYTVDGNGNGSLEVADRSQAESGNYNPAIETTNPLDFALFRRVWGYDGSGNGGALEPMVPYLFTNATTDAVYPTGGSPDPLFVYILTEDLNGDGKLDDAECVNDVVDTCPPGTARDPQQYIWGDTDFDGTLSESEKNALRSMEVGSTSWAKNPLLDSGSYKSTTLASAIDPTSASPHRISVSDGTKLGKGYHVKIGTGGTAEWLTVEHIFTSGTPHRAILSSDPQNAHSSGATVEVVPSTLLHSIRSVEVTYTTITGDRDADGDSRIAGRAGRQGDFGLDYRVTPFQRTVELLNATTAAPLGGP